jgi:hypothetical protein
MVSSSSPHLGASDSHNTWTTTRGSPHKHFTLDIGEHRFTCTRKTDQIAAEAALDGT